MPERLPAYPDAPTPEEEFVPEIEPTDPPPDTPAALIPTSPAPTGRRPGTLTT